MIYENLHPTRQFNFQFDRKCLKYVYQNQPIYSTYYRRTTPGNLMIQSLNLVSEDTGLAQDQNPDAGNVALDEDEQINPSVEQMVGGNKAEPGIPAHNKSSEKKNLSFEKDKPEIAHDPAHRLRSKVRDV